MTHYEKLATMIFRIIGIFFLVLAVFLLILSSIFLLIGIFRESDDLRIGLGILINYAFPTIVTGFLIFKVSGKLAKKACFDLNNE